MNVADIKKFLKYLKDHPNNPSMIARLSELHSQVEDEANAIIVMRNPDPVGTPPRDVFPTAAENEVWNKLKELNEIHFPSKKKSATVLVSR